MSRLRKSVMALSLFALLFGFGASSVMADDPPPTDPTLRTSGGIGGDPVVASPEAWDIVVEIIIAAFPDNYDEETINYYALLWFNLLPPDYSGG
ncbi:MAG: hypothetical protein K8T89_12245 [Planctomycetes bacterium]|nr:hypothetical protein [Planctomycetota bacterium]